MEKKNRGWLTVAVLAIIAAIALTFGRPPATREAKASVDSWSGHQEVQVPFQASITAGTSALVTTGTTGVAWNIRAITVSNSASGYVSLYSGSAVQGVSLIGIFWVIANTPLVLNEDMCGQGITTALGQGIYVNATTGTVTMQLRVRKDAVSPNAAH
jgi:hypothetical protein